MAKISYRNIHTELWEHADFEDLDTEEMGFYIWLLTNNRISLSGILNITLKRISFECHLEVKYEQEGKKRAEEILDKLTDMGKVEYYPEHNIIFVKNYFYKQGITSQADSRFTSIINDIADLPDTIKESVYKHMGEKGLIS